METFIEQILNESRWLFVAMLTSVLVVGGLRNRFRRESRRMDILWGMNLFFGIMIGVMSFGHLLAVTLKVALGTLETNLFFLYGMGLALAIPSWWLALGVGKYVQDESRYRGRLIALNAWLGLSLIALGLHNLPLAIPAGLNLAYQFHRRRKVGWTILLVAIAGNLALFIGSLVFFLSGQSFEQFQGME